MITDWLYRINVIIQASEIGFINALWTVIAPNGDAEAESFGVPLSASGEEPATHSGISTAATEEMRIFIEEIFMDELSDAIISVQDYTLNDWDDFLVANELQLIEEELL